MSNYLLPSMGRLVTQPWKNLFLIGALEKHNEKLIRDIPELLTILAIDPKAFDRVSLKIRQNDNMSVGTTILIWATMTSVAPWVAEQVAGYWCEYRMAANPDIVSCTVDTIDHMAHAKRIFFGASVFSGLHYWEWFRIQFLRQQLEAEERAASRVVSE